MYIVHLPLLFPLPQFSVLLKSYRSSKRWYQHIVAPDGFTSTASFSPIFAFRASSQLILFHGHCTGNVQFKFITAVMILEITVKRIEDSSGKTIGNSNKKTTQKQYNKNNDDTTSKQIETTLLLNTMLLPKFSAWLAYRHCKFRLAGHIIGRGF